MKFKFRNLTLISLILFLLVIVSCKKKTSIVSNIDSYSDYVSIFPEKVISSAANLQFLLKKTPNTNDINSDVLTITPNVKGEVIFKNNMLTFIPSEKLLGNKEYRVTLHLSKLYNTIEKGLEDFTVKIKTKELLFNVLLDAPKVYDKNWYYVEGTFTASDFIDSKELPELITASFNQKLKKIKFDATEGYTSKAYFKIDSLQRFDDDNVLEVSWNGSTVKSSSNGKEELTISGKRNFKILNIEVIDSEKQQIEISFSDPVEKSQDLNGLIQFTNIQKRKFTHKIENNVITLFPVTSFKNTVDIEVFKEIKNTEGYQLKQNYKETLYFQQLKPSVSFVKSGTILPDSDNLKINFKSVNLRAVDVTIYKIYKDNILQFLQYNNLSNKDDIRYVGRPIVKYTTNLSDRGVDLSRENAFAVNLADFIEIDHGAIYRVELSYSKEYSNYTCNGSIAENTIVYGKKEIDKKRYNTTRYYYNNHYDGEYRWRDRDNPCTSSYFYNKRITSNILATNLGVIVKKGNNHKTFIAVTDLITANPVAGATVVLYNLQQQPIIEMTTDAKGIVVFDQKLPAFFAIATKDKNTTYVKLSEGNALSMSKFDVSGAKLQEGLKGYIYGERGIWRPGDPLFLTFVLNDKANPLPEKHPIKFELINPLGKIIDRKILQKNKTNVYAYTPKTDQESITGNWKVKVTVGGASFYKSLKIETIKPNRLKIKMKTSEQIIKASSPIKGAVEVKWLHGAVAKDLKLDIHGKFSQTNTVFPTFKNYKFDDISRRFGTEEFRVFKGNLNNEGTINFSVSPKLDDKAPGMLKISLITKVYENGGDFSSDVFTKKVSPYKSYAGLLNAEESQSRNYLFTNEKYKFNVAAVNENGKGISNDLEVKVYKLSWRWWWRSSEDGLSNYDGTRYHEPYQSLDLKTDTSGRGSFNLTIDKNDWGRYLIKVFDKKSKHATSSIVYFDWPAWYGNKKGSHDKTNASMLIFTTDKEFYKVNETAKVKFPSSEGGRALITIESGTEVLDHFWVETKPKQTEFSFPVLDSYTPNVFVNISLLQKHGQTVNDLPIRMYGAIPMMVYNPSTKLEPQIQLADELRPEATGSIQIREKEGKPMTYTIAIVDEGLLDLTRFKTPNPWNTFFARQSLGVRTWDVFDDVIGAYGGKIDQVLSIGGDESEAASKNKKANRFKPMVTYLGPFNLESGASRDHKFKIPNYVGSVRAMVIATNAAKEAYGSNEKTAFVRKPLMILASLPRKIAPQETVTLPVTVFAMKSNIKQVKLKVAPHESYTILGSDSEIVRFDQPDEKMAYFKLKVTDFKGIGKIKLEASSGDEKATYEVEIDVENPNPETTEVKDVVLKAKEQSKINFTTFGTRGTNTATIELSTLPPINFTERLAYLIRYPHGCVEQTTSSVFPQLYFPEIFELSKKKKQAIERNIKASIISLSNFQLSNGGLSYWKGDGNASHWGTSYAGHFMLEASKKGYALPIGFKNKWINYQKNQARKWRYSHQQYNNDLNQAYRLYTLSLANSPDLASMNRLKEISGISNEAKLRLAAAYALIGKKSVANSIILKLTSEKQEKKTYDNYGSKTRNDAMALETYLLVNNQIKAIKLAKNIAEALSSSLWMSTQTTAYSLLAISNYALRNGESSGITATYSLNEIKEKINIGKSFFSEEISVSKKENVLTILNNGSSALFLRILNKGVLPVGEEKVIQRNLKVTLNYTTKKGMQIHPENLIQGTNFIAEVTIKNETNTKVDHIALTQYIPSGWEIINTRYTDFGSSTSTSKAAYTDIRDTSISNYFTLKGFETKMFRVLLNASYLGNYYLPGLQAEAMYDNNYVSRTKGQWVKVVK